MFKTNKSYKINTPSGFQYFNGIQEVHKNGQVEIQLYNGSIIKCSPKHRLLTISGWKPACLIASSDSVVTKNGNVRVFHVEYYSGVFKYFDIVGVQDHQFYANDVVSHNCEFLGSANTLIHPNKLRNLTFITPIESKNGLDIYEEPDITRSYACIVDTSRGLDNDFSAFIIVDITDAPYKIVAKYRDRTISPMIYPNVIYNVAKKYNEAYTLVEINDNGQQIADILHYDLEYENVIVTASHNGVQSVSSGYGGHTTLGIRTTKQVKRIGCSTLKDLIEDDKLLVQDFEVIEELSNFVQKGQSYEAEEGFNDDLVMCCVLFSWLVRQNYFKELTNLDIRDRILKEKQKMIEDDILPFGILDDGQLEEDGMVINTFADPWYDPGNKF